MISTRSVTTTTDVAYGPDPLQMLDLYRPDIEADVPVVLYLHGGGWQLGDKTADARERLTALASHGIAVASANYRLVPAHRYPAQVHDAKAAVRWLREKGPAHGLSVHRIGAWGASAGGYLASLIGLTNDDPAFEGADSPPVSSRVDAVVDWFGQSDLVANATRSWLEKEVLPPPFELAFLGVDGSSTAGLAASASPLRHISAAAPPFLIVHGDRDRVTPIAESAALHDSLVRAGAESTLVVLGGAGHESHTFDRADHLAMTAAFLLQHLQSG